MAMMWHEAEAAQIDVTHRFGICFW